VNDLWELLVSFARAGLFGFGGGPSMIPLIQVEVVELRGWLTRDAFLDAFAFGNALPGPIATKLAGYVGFQVAGVAGAAAGLVGVTLPTIVAMVALAGAYARYRDHSAVRRFLAGVRPVVLALLALVVWDFAPAALLAAPVWWANLPLWAIAALAVLVSLRRDPHPALLIVAGGVLGLLVAP
jgi:chromate transporter